MQLFRWSCKVARSFDRWQVCRQGGGDQPTCGRCVAVWLRPRFMDTFSTHLLLVWKFLTCRHLLYSKALASNSLSHFQLGFWNQTPEVNSLPPQVTAEESPRPIWQSESEEKHRSAARRHLQKTLCLLFSFLVSASFRTQHFVLPLFCGCWQISVYYFTSGRITAEGASFSHCSLLTGGWINPLQRFRIDLIFH